MKFVKFFGKNNDVDSLADGVIKEVKQYKKQPEQCYWYPHFFSGNEIVNEFWPCGSKLQQYV